MAEREAEGQTKMDLGNDPIITDDPHDPNANSIEAAATFDKANENGP